MTRETRPPKPLLLSIDDEVTNNFTRRLLLESAGYSVLVAHRGYEGLAMLKANQVDAVIVDYLMPDMKGGEVVQEIRRIKPSVPILMLSGCLEIPASVVAMVDACISKAEPPALLFSHIESVLHKPPTSVPRGSNHRSYGVA